MFKFGVPKSYPGHKTLGKHANSKMSQKEGEVHNFECFEYNESYKCTHNDTKNPNFNFGILKTEGDLKGPIRFCQFKEKTKSLTYDL